MTKKRKGELIVFWGVIILALVFCVFCLMQNEGMRIENREKITLLDKDLKKEKIMLKNTDKVHKQWVEEFSFRLIKHEESIHYGRKIILAPNK